MYLGVNWLITFVVYLLGTVGFCFLPNLGSFLLLLFKIFFQPLSSSFPFQILTYKWIFCYCSTGP